MKKTYAVLNTVGFFAVIIIFTVFTAIKGGLSQCSLYEALPYLKQAQGAQAEGYEANGSGGAGEKPLNDTDITFDEAEEKAEPNFTIEGLNNFDYIKSRLYIVDSRTNLLESDIDAEKFLNADLTLDTTQKGPKILIFHTHSTEGFADSDMTKDMNEGIWGVGERLAEILRNDYGVDVLHDMGRYDIVDGKSRIQGAYERMEPSIRKILEANPSIELVIDMHRDGVGSDVRLVKEINGKKCAKIMFFNGLCRVYSNGELKSANGLVNPYLKDNLALSFNMQVTAESMYPSFSRRIYVNAYRYSLHMLPKSMLIEVGGQTNTKEEAMNAMEPLAEILAKVVLEEKNEN